MLQRNEIPVAMTEQELKRALAPLTSLQLPWKLPFEIRKQKESHRKKKDLRVTTSDGRPLTDTISFQDVALNGALEFSVPDVPHLTDIEFSNHQSAVPLFTSGNSLKANIPLPMDEVPWRLLRRNTVIFPVSGGGRLEFLQKGLFLSARGKLLERRMVIHNDSRRTVQIAINPDEEWLAAEPSKFVVDPGASSHVVLRLIPEKLSPGTNRAKIKIKGADEPLILKARVNAGLRKLPVFLNKEMELPLAGIGPAVELELKLMFAEPGEVRGTVLDSLHKTHRNFHVSGGTGEATVFISLPTSKLPEVGREAWPLKICLDIKGVVQTHSVEVRLLRELQFKPEMAVLRDDAPVSVLASQLDDSPVKLVPGFIPPGITTTARQNQISIARATSHAPESHLSWLEVCNEVSGEHALFPVLFLGEMQ